MVKLNSEYFNSPYYFYLKDKGDKVAIYYSVSDTLTESRKNDNVIVVDKSIFEDMQKVIASILKSGKKLTKEYVHKLLDSKAKSVEKPDGELGELVNPDGSIIGSSIPILNQRNLAKKTMDQTVRMTKSTQFPFIRVYYGENEDKGNNIVSEEDSMCDEHISPSGKKTTMCPDDDDYEMNYGKNAVNEVDQSESFGFEETEFAPTYDVANKILKKLEVDDPIERDERLKRLGFDRKLDKQLKQEKKYGKCKNCFTKRRLAELEKEKMETLIDEIILSKKSKDKEVVKKSKEENDDDNNVMSKLLIRNIEAIKRLADKENISINKLIKHLKTGE
jgi:hypothetical protein